MTTISATVIASSISPVGKRLDTLQLRYPRFIHPENMTHRVFSRNASSSRAVPILTLLKQTVADMAEPVEWGSNKPGMQAGAELSPARKWLARRVWRSAGWVAAGAAYLMAKTGAHKQIANRIIEPWSHIDVVLSSTDWENFFIQRCAEDADPTMRALAVAVRRAIAETYPTSVTPGDHWCHLPYLRAEDWESGVPFDPAMVSAARCARVSYGDVRNRMKSVEEDMKLAQWLVEHRHLSPFEHIAKPDSFNRAHAMRGEFDWTNPELHGNFDGFIQLRKIVEKPGFKIAA